MKGGEPQRKNSLFKFFGVSRDAEGAHLDFKMADCV